MARFMIDESPLTRLDGVLSPRAAPIPAEAPPSPRADSGVATRAIPSPIVSNAVTILEIYPVLR